MAFYEFQMKKIDKHTDDIFIVTATTHQPYTFIAGQHCTIKNPAYRQPEEEHYFSLASSPNTPCSVEFCIRAYGPWTSAFIQLPVRSHFWLSDAHGAFTLPQKATPLLFLAGGMGIAPIISLLRYAHEQNYQAPITLIFGNRNQGSIVYFDELQRMFDRHNWKVVHILSEPDSLHPWSGHRGFITAEVLTHEVDFTTRPLVYINGPKEFLSFMNASLSQMNIPPSRIITEQ